MKGLHLKRTMPRDVAYLRVEENIDDFTREAFSLSLNLDATLMVHFKFSYCLEIEAKGNLYTTQRDGF